MSVAFSFARVPRGEGVLLGGTGSSLRHQVDLRLLGGFAVLRGGERVDLPLGAQRLVAFVALGNRAVQREYAAGMLWLDSPDERAAANLRSTLWRVQKRVPGLLETRGTSIELDSRVEVDLRAAAELARRAIDGSDDVRIGSLGTDLLPDWYDDWISLERERYRQLRLLALDALCERHRRSGRLDRALDAGLEALLAEPLRESTHAALIRVHLAAGNVAEALRQHSLCRRLLREQLGVEPTEGLARLIDDASVTPR